MNEIDLLRELRAGLPAPRAEARAGARGRLLAHMEHPVELRPARRFAWPRLRLRLVAAAAIACLLAAVVVVLGVFDNGHRVESAAAAVLHRTASVAAADDTPALQPPGPGQFLYTKTENVELMGWTPHGYTGSKDEPRPFSPKVPNVYPHAPRALVPTIVEKWTAPDGTIRQRETLGEIKFFSAADQRRWEAAGSPPPWSFDPRFHDVKRGGPGGAVKEFTTRKWAPDIGFPDPAELPTDPRALRQKVERGQVSPPWVLGGVRVGPNGKPTTVMGPEDVIEQLFEILEKPTTTPALRAAAFNALAEIPQIRLVRNVTDIAGRTGDAVAFGSDGFGLRREFIFDPQTATLLAESETIVNPKAFDPAVPAGTPFRQKADLAAGIVDSSHETAGEAEASSG